MSLSQRPEEFVEVEVPLKVLAKEEPKTNVKVVTALDVRLGNASTCLWEGPKGSPR